MNGALLIIDVINDLDFEGGETLQPWGRRMVPPLKRVCAFARRRKIPVIYVNDNFGRWRSDFREVYRHCTRLKARGRHISRQMKPTAGDYFILKPRHSAFFATSLVPLLEFLEIHRLILTAIATNICVLFSAHDAHMNDYKTIVLSDCCAAESDKDHAIALDQLCRFCGTHVVRAAEYIAR